LFGKICNNIKTKSIKNNSPTTRDNEILDEHRTHPTADRIYIDLKEKNPALSKTTVYNSVETLKEHGIIQSLTISGSELRYDFENKMHHHFLCKKCGNIIDIDVECAFLNEFLYGKHRVDEVHGYFKGICENCLKKGLG